MRSETRPIRISASACVLPPSERVTLEEEPHVCLARATGYDCTPEIFSRFVRLALLLVAEQKQSSSPDEKYLHRRLGRVLPGGQPCRDSTHVLRSPQLTPVILVGTKADDSFAFSCKSQVTRNDRKCAILTKQT